MPTLTGVPLVVPLVPLAELVELAGDELQAATASAIVATPAAPASAPRLDTALRLGLDSVRNER